MSIRSRHPEPAGARWRRAGRGWRRAGRGWGPGTGRRGGAGGLVAVVAVVTVAAVAAGLLLGACAEPSTERGSASGGSASTVGPPSSRAPASPPTTAPSPPSSSGAGQVVVRGTVRDGVEAGCVLLDGHDKHAYLLLGAKNAQLREGARVEVVGQPVDQIASFCGEGSALSVVSVRPLT